jgi:mono/diheme cytochrome c family protein
MTKPNQPSSQRGKAGKPSPVPATRPASGSADSEPSVQRNPVPPLLVLLLAGVMYWGSMYVIEFGGEADARVHYPYPSYKYIEGLVPPKGDAAAIAKGQAVYAQICMGCHQADGNGATAQNAPPLAGSEWVLAKDPARIIRIVLHGLSGPIKVKDKDWGAGQMVAWKDALDNEQIASVLTYVRNSWGNKAPVVNAEFVKTVREETKDHPGYMTVADLEKVTLKE